MCSCLNQSLWLEEFSVLIGTVWSCDPAPKASNGATFFQSCGLRVREEGSPKGNSGAVTKNRDGPEWIQNKKFLPQHVIREREPDERLAELEMR